MILLSENLVCSVAGEFHARGEIYFPSIRGEGVVIHQQTPLTKQDLLMLDESSKNDGLYRIRVSSKLKAVTSKSKQDEDTWIYSYTYAVGFLSCEKGNIFIV